MTEKKPTPAYIKLTQPHTHKGTDYEPGTILELREDQVTRLIEAKRGTASTADAFNKQQQEKNGDQ